MPAAAMTAARAYLAMSPALVAGTTLSALVFINSLPAPAGVPCRLAPVGPRAGAGPIRYGTPGGTRTPNLRFWRPLLCQLSYWRNVFSENGDGGSRRLRRFQRRPGAS